MNVAGLAHDSTKLLRAIADGRPGGATLRLVITNDEETPAMRSAKDLAVSTSVVDHHDTAGLHAAFSDHEIDLVVADDLRPGSGTGGLGRAPPVLVHDPTLEHDVESDDHVAATLASGRRLTGSTVRVLSRDGGAVITQEPVAVYQNDDRADLADRIYRDGAITAVTRAVRWYARGGVTVDDGRATVAADVGGPFPARRIATADLVANLRYGENPHQEAALYGRPTAEANVIDADQLNEGAKALSYNNYNDADAALDLVKEFDRPAAAVIKHTNPAGCATAETLSEAYDRALSTDPQSAFGGIVALNRTCDRPTARAITDSFKEVVIAPAYTEAGLTALREQSDLRVLDVGEFQARDGRAAEPQTEKALVGGRLVQDRDRQDLTATDLTVVTERSPTEAQVESMVFAWRTIKHVKSNAIVYATGTETVGVGAGQMSRVDAVRLASMKADEHAEGKSADGAVMASDAFFPFPDGIERAAEAGIEAVIQPGGSVNDDDVIRAANDLEVVMVFTGTRCFRHD